jgi:hypothetical protein
MNAIKSACCKNPKQRWGGDLLIRVHSAFVELPREAFRQVPHSHVLVFGDIAPEQKRGI